jgi:hypothetical protein
VREGAFGRGGRAGRADCGEIEREERFGKRRAAIACLFLHVTEPDDHGILGPDKRREALELTDRRWPMARDQREVHRCCLTRRLDGRLVEVGVPVEEQEAGATAAPQRQRPAQQHAAIAAQDERHVAAVEYSPDRVRQGHGVLGDLGPVEHTACRVHAAGPARGRDSRGDACIQCLGQAVPQQSVAEPLHSGGPQAEPRGRLNDGKAQSRSRRRSSAAPAA